MKINHPFVGFILIGLAIMGCSKKVPDFERTVFDFDNQRIEIHHSTWCSGNWESADFSLIEYLVLEGRLDILASEQYNSVSNPLTNFLTKTKNLKFGGLLKTKSSKRGVLLPNYNIHANE